MIYHIWKITSYMPHAFIHATTPVRSAVVLHEGSGRSTLIHMPEANPGMMPMRADVHLTGYYYHDTS